MATSPGGYTMVASDGGVFNFGTAFYGSMGGKYLSHPIVGLLTAEAGNGYSEFADDGYVYTFGPGAPFYGVLPDYPKAGTIYIVGAASLADGGYVDFTGNGGAYFFTSNGPIGSLGVGYPLKPLVGGAGVPAAS